MLRAYATYLRASDTGALLVLLKAQPGGSHDSQTASAGPAPSTAMAWVAGQPHSLRVSWPQLNEYVLLDRIT